MIFLAIILTAACNLSFGIWIGRAIRYANPTDENFPQAIFKREQLSLFVEEGAARCDDALVATRMGERSPRRSE